MTTIMELMPGITLRCFPDRRFKQGCLSFAIVRPMAQEEAAVNALIPAVLLRGTRKCRPAGHYLEAGRSLWCHPGHPGPPGG